MIENNAKPILKKKKKVNTNINWTAGRPNSIDEKLLAKLEEWFMMSLTDDECCLYCNINPSTLYRYIDKNPDFSKRKELLKRTPNIQAKANWVKEIKQGTYASSKEWLERRSKDEFSLKIETKNETDINMNIEVAWASDDELDKIINS